MVRFQPLFLALCLGLTTATTLAATDMNGTDTHPRADQSPAKQPYDNTGSQGNSVNNPDSTRDNDSSDTSSDVPDGTTGGSNNTGEATGTGAGASGGAAEDQDSR